GARRDRRRGRPPDARALGDRLPYRRCAGGRPRVLREGDAALASPLAGGRAAGSASHCAALGQRAERATSRGATPMYSARGRMSRLSAYCSSAWAHQPATRPTAKIDVQRSPGMPSAWYTTAEKKSTLTGRPVRAVIVA